MTKQISIPYIHPGIKLVLSGIVGVIAYLQATSTSFDQYTRLMIGWDFLGLTYIVISILILYTTHSSRLRSIAQKQDIGQAKKIPADHQSCILV